MSTAIPPAIEINFDGLVGPTHNYAGLSFGNVAAMSNAGSISNPRQAAKQGLQKMRALLDLGVAQAVLPPQQRPNLDLLRVLGFSCTESEMLEKAYKYQPELLSACYSASSMWTANMATVSQGANTADNRLHLTPANLTYTLHRAQEAAFNYKLLQKVFADPQHFMVHAPLPAYRDLSDEGAANHNLLCADYGVAGMEMFVYGRNGLDDKSVATKFPARQTRLASSSVMRNHGVRDAMLVQQNPAAIDAGVFHNDVICVTNKNVLFYHADAFVDWEPNKQAIKAFLNDACYFLEVSAQQLSIVEAVQTYIFNSQLVSLPDNSMALIVPMECKESVAATAVLNGIVAGDNPIKMVQHVECRQSMRNGGGPACLRLRVVVSNAQHMALHQGVLLNRDLYSKLDAWIEKHYRDRLELKDLLDPLLYSEVLVALDQLTQILQLGSIYSFQTT